MLQLAGEESVSRPGLWKEISFGDYICHTFQGDVAMISKLEQRLHTMWTKYYKQAIVYNHLTLSLKFDKLVFPGRSALSILMDHLYQQGLFDDCWADRSPLHEAAAQGRLLALKTLIAQGINVNLVTINRVSSLHEACLGGHVACAKALLENGAHVNGLTVHGATPLFNACCSGSAACVNVLLEFGAKAQLEVYMASPIHEAVKRGHRECMEILLANNVNIEQEVPQLGTPLYVACTYERVDCVKKLLELGANVDHGRWLDTPLHAAARQSSVEVINLLTEYGASLKLRNSEGKSALDLAAPKSSVEQALLLHEGPPALSQLCRLCVRKCLGRACHQAICQLGLPEPLEKFLLYQ